MSAFEFALTSQPPFIGTLSPRQDEHSLTGRAALEARLRLLANLSGGLAGKGLGRVIEPFVSIAIRQTEATLRSNIERQYRAEHD